MLKELIKFTIVITTFVSTYLWSGPYETEQAGMSQERLDRIAPALSKYVTSGRIPGLITAVAPAVAMSAVRTGVAQEEIPDWNKYRESLKKRLGLDNELIRTLTARAKRNPKKVVFAEAEHYKILKAAQQVKDDGIAEPILLGRKQKIQDLIEKFSIEFDDVIIVDPKDIKQEPKRHEYGDLFWEKRKRKGITQFEARKLMRERNYYGSMMVEMGDADALISGITRNYRATVKPALEVIGKEEGVNNVVGMYIMRTKKGTLFFLAKFIAAILPSVPLLPNPPGINIPEALFNLFLICSGFK